MRPKLTFMFLATSVGCALSGADASSSTTWHAAGTPAIVSEEIQFSNGDARLVGTVFRPGNGAHLPGVVALHHASAPERGSELYRHLREALPALGFAVLVYDRRGAGKSTGDVRNADFETLADDAIAGQRALAKLPGVDAKRIGFWGLSQGGWLAVIAAGRSKDAAFAVSVSAPLVTAEKQMEFAMTNLLEVRGYPQGEVQDMLKARSAWQAYLHGTSSRDAASAALREAESRPWFDQVYLPKASQLPSDAEHDASRRRLDGDPVAAILRTKVPLLFLFGDSDPWVPVAESVARLQMLQRRRDLEYAVIADTNHEMMLAPRNETMQVESSTQFAPQTPAYLMLLSSWLARHALAPRR